MTTTNQEYLSCKLDSSTSVWLMLLTQIFGNDRAICLYVCVWTNTDKVLKLYTLAQEEMQVYDVDNHDGQDF